MPSLSFGAFLAPPPLLAASSGNVPSEPGR